MVQAIAKETFFLTGTPDKGRINPHISPTIIYPCHCEFPTRRRRGEQRRNTQIYPRDFGIAIFPEGDEYHSPGLRFATQGKVPP